LAEVVGQAGLGGEEVRGVREAGDGKVFACLEAGVEGVPGGETVFGARFEEAGDQ
jgi:hypothetical protein